MKNKVHSLSIIVAILAGIQQAGAQGTAFTYQGQLSASGSPANGLYDFQFSLSNAPSGGSQVGNPINLPAVGVTNGLFATTLDFGSVFTGNPVWLAISVRSNATGNYTGLTPLKELNPTPYSIFANTASNVSGTVPAAQLRGMVSQSVLPGFQSSANYATVGGGTGNTASGQNTTVGGGIGNSASGLDTTVGGGSGNTASGTTFAETVGGGINNTATGQAATVAGGEDNLATGDFSAVAGGFDNHVGGSSATAGGGYGNIVNGAYAFVGGGYGNTAGGYGATVPGGYNNQANGEYAFAAGQNAQATNQGAFVWADSQAPAFGSTNNDSFNVRAQGGVHYVTSGAGVTVDGQPVFAGINGGSLTNLKASQLTGGPIPLAQLPAAVLTNNEANATLANVTVGGNLNLPATATIYAGGSTLFVLGRTS